MGCGLEVPVTRRFVGVLRSGGVCSEHALAEKKYCLDIQVIGSLSSLVAEHSLSKRKVAGSNPV